MLTFLKCLFAKNQKTPKFIDIHLFRMYNLIERAKKRYVIEHKANLLAKSKNERRWKYGKKL